MKRISEFKGYRTAVSWNAEARRFEQVCESWPEFPAQPHSADVLLYKPKRRTARTGPERSRRLLPAGAK